MRWEKRGLIYAPDGAAPWAKRSALQPTPYVMRDNVIRVYAGFRDDAGSSRVGFVDVDARDPSVVLRVSEQPALDIGIPGTFDDNGVVPCAVVERNGALYLYYAGYQLGHKVRFFVFGGLAISRDGGETFTRHSKVPVLERSDSELFFRVAHSVLLEDGVWKIWYGAGSEWVEGGAKSLPKYDIRFLQSPDGVTFTGEGQICVALEGADEYRVGRPYVLKDAGRYRMFYATATTAEGYRLGYAESTDGATWQRKDDEIGITVSESGWDSLMIAYPSVVPYGDTAYLFYNGNNMGETGFGYAVLGEW